VVRWSVSADARAGATSRSPGRDGAATGLLTVVPPARSGPAGAARAI
jgi:hypothetical protein